MAPLMAVYPIMVVMAKVKLLMREGTLSGSSTCSMICIGVAPMLCAVSMMLGFTSRRLDSTSRATKGKAATTSGTMEATVPTEVPMISRVSGMTITIRIRKGMERNRLITTFRNFIKGFGRGRMPFASPATRIMPNGRPITMAKKVAKKVTYTVSHKACGKSLRNIAQASCNFSGVNALAKFMPVPPLRQMRM